MKPVKIPWPHQPARLVLRRQTVAVLTPLKLADVRGGADTPSASGCLQEY